MKKLIALLAIMTMFLGFNTLTFAADDTELNGYWEQGDLNGDGGWDEDEFFIFFEDNEEVGEEQFDWYDFDNNNEWDEDEWKAFTDDANKKGVFDI